MAKLVISKAFFVSLAFEPGPLGIQIVTRSFLHVYKLSHALLECLFFLVGRACGAAYKILRRALKDCSQGGPDMDFSSKHFILYFIKVFCKKIAFRDM
jgi:hypothetical protein